MLPEAEIVRLGQGQDFEALLADAAARCDVLGVGGSDGTLQAGARHAIEHDVPLAVFPAGIFIGNGRYDPPGDAPQTRLRMDDGQLDLRFLERGSRWAAVRTLFAVFTGGLGRLPLYHEFDAPKAHLEVVGGPIPFARDGEVTGSGTVLDLDVAYRALTVYRPRTGSWSRVLRRFGWRRQGVTAS